MKIIQKTAIALAASGLFSTAALAQAAPADAPEASPVATNVTIVNDYRYRGLSQSNFKPAIQGGFDYAHESGFYIGNWNSSISWISDSFGQNGGYGGNGSAGKTVSAPIEMDFYAGFKKEVIGEGFASDIGFLQYYYPTSGIPAGATNPNTSEVYVAQSFTFGPLTGFANFSYAVSTTFGTANSTGSYYPDLILNYNTGVWGMTLNGHIGYQYSAGNVNDNSTSYVGNSILNGIRNSTLYSYTDQKLGVTKDFGSGLSAAIAYIGTNAATYQGGYACLNPQGKNLGRSTDLISLTKTF